MPSISAVDLNREAWDQDTIDWEVDRALWVLSELRGDLLAGAEPCTCLGLTVCKISLQAIELSISARNLFLI